MSSTVHTFILHACQLKSLDVYGIIQYPILIWVNSKKSTMLLLIFKKPKQLKNFKKPPQNYGIFLKRLQNYQFFRKAINNKSIFKK